jgi:O-antigen ligase
VLASIFMLLLLRPPRNLRRYAPLFVGTFASIVVVYAVAVLDIVPGLSILLQPFAALSGKDLTFSNRSLIWSIVKEHIVLSPYVGSGYGAYWVGPFPTSPSYVFLKRMYFYPSEAHNGYLEIFNDLGMLGLACLLGYLVFYVRQSLQLMKIDRTQGVLFLSFFFQQAITNLSESCWLAVNNVLPFFVMTLATITLARSSLDHRLRRQSANRANPAGLPLPP